MTKSGTIQYSSREPKTIYTFVEPKWSKGSIWSGLECLEHFIVGESLLKTGKGCFNALQCRK